MNYRAIGLMSGSSLDGLDIVCAAFEAAGGRWSYRIEAADCLPYPPAWRERLRDAVALPALDYQLLHSEYGHYLGRQVNAFIAANDLQYRVALVASHGHTTFHLPPRLTGQLGCGAAIAAETGLPVVSDLRALDVALGGQGAPIVPTGERLLFPDIRWFLNLGGIANLTASHGARMAAFDTCPANRVLDLLAARAGAAFDEGGRIAASGSVDTAVLAALDALPYYALPYPKSLANDFGTDTVFPILSAAGLSPADALRTAVEHIARQVARGVAGVIDAGDADPPPAGGGTLLVTGGGALNHFLVRRIADHLEPLRLRAEPADPLLANYKEALIMALLGVLRWREEPTTRPEVTGATWASVGGALWMGRT